jgi:hypothetical protein
MLYLTLGLGLSFEKCKLREHDRRRQTITFAVPWHGLSHCALLQGCRHAELG